MAREEILVADPSNAGQVGAWDGDDGAFWTAQAHRFDQAVARIHSPFLAAADVRAGDRVLDVGCGTGRATRDVARIAVDGSVLGVDLSSEMLAVAGKGAAAEGLDNVEFRQADAQIHPFQDGEFDAVISRTGSMFFGDPIAAFTNLHRALRPGGRLTLLTWQSLADQEWLTAFRSAVAVGRTLPMPPPDAPGPFSQSDPARVEAVLGQAGFTGISFQGVHEPMNFGTDPDDVFGFVSDFTAWMRADLDEEAQKSALDALRSTIIEHAGEEGVTYRSATWIIQARTR